MVKGYLKLWYTFYKEKVGCSNTILTWFCSQFATPHLDSFGLIWITPLGTQVFCLLFTGKHVNHFFTLIFSIKGLDCREWGWQSYQPVGVQGLLWKDVRLRVCQGYAEDTQRVQEQTWSSPSHSWLNGKCFLWSIYEYTRYSAQKH